MLGPKSGIPTLAAARLQRWALLLAAYQYDIEYRSTAKHANADCLSRLPINIDKPDEGVDEVKLINLLQIESLPLNVDHVRKATQTDPILSRVLEYTMTGWPDKQTAPEITQYFNERHEITGVVRITHRASRNSQNEITRTTSRLVAEPRQRHRHGCSAM